MNQQSRTKSSNKTLTLALVALTLFIVCYFPVFRILVEKWADSEDYTHAFFMVPIIIYLVWGKKEYLVNRQGGNTLFGLPLVILSILLYLLSLQLQIPTVCSLAMVMTLLSVLVYLSGFAAIKELVVPIVLLILIIPIPNQIYSMLTLPMQLKVSQASEIVLQLFSVPVLRDGNIIQIPGKTFLIVEACSGLRSMIALITFSLTIGIFMLTKTLSRVLLLILSVPVAFFINIIRVVSMTLAFHYFKVDLSVGTKHTVLGFVVFGIALAIILMFEKILEKWEIK